MEFLDTNVLVYAASDRTADQQKAGVARGEEKGRISFQLTPDEKNRCVPWYVGFNQKEPL